MFYKNFFIISLIIGGLFILINIPPYILVKQSEKKSSQNDVPIISRWCSPTTMKVSPPLSTSTPTARSPSNIMRLAAASDLIVRLRRCRARSR